LYAHIAFLAKQKTAHLGLARAVVTRRLDAKVVLQVRSSMEVLSVEMLSVEMLEQLPFPFELSVEQIRRIRMAP
jgi:hypothetical protein